MTLEYRCTVCGATAYRTSSKAHPLYCPACREKVRRKRNRDSMARSYKRDPERHKNRTKEDFRQMRDNAYDAVDALSAAQRKRLRELLRAEIGDIDDGE